MANLSIDYAAITQCANDMKSVNTKLTQKLGEIQTAMKAVNTADVYFSTDAADCLEKFEAMATKRIPQFESVINEYVQFLDNAIAKYKETNAALTQNVESNIDAFV